MWGNHVRWDSKICFAYLEFFHGTLEGPWETRDHLDLEAKLHGIALKKTKRKLPTNTSSRQSRHVQHCMSLWQSDNQVHVNLVGSKRRLKGYGMVVVHCVWHRYHQPQEWLLNNGGHWHKQPCRKRQENAATFTNGMLTCEHISKNNLDPLNANNCLWMSDNI